MARVRLHSLKLTGFKSFPDGVELSFPGSVSAIIGPNGCGKSNLVDAILWVLGEQSPSLLRLKNMGDVVFSGAAGRKPAGSAEVSLVLHSNDERWADDDGRLEIRRRVLRSGPSDYRMNGRSARLRDIADELAAVGLGTRSYAIIEQGRVGQVLSARPTDRRTLIEEAAGITRYKARRRETELKLEHTRQNLLRLDDVITEVKRSLRQLRRQAKQAERHQGLTAELREVLTGLHTLEAKAIQACREELTRRRGVVQNELAAAASALGGSEADLAGARRDLDTARGATEAVREEVGRLETATERLEAFLERSADLMDTLRASLDRNRADTAAAEQKRTESTGILDEASARSASCREAAEAVAARVEEARTEEAAARSALEDDEQVTARIRSDLLRTISALTTSRNQLGDLEREKDRLTYVASQLEQERDRLQARREQVSERHREVGAGERSASERVGRLKTARHEIAASRDGLREEAQAVKSDAEAYGHEVWELRHRLAGVERDLARHAAAAERLVDLLPAEAVAGQVSDYLTPDADSADALDRLWRDWLEAPVVLADALDEQVRAALAELAERVRLVLVDEGAPVPPWPDLPECRSLRSCAGIRQGAEGWLGVTLPPAFVCESPDLARQRALEHPGVAILDGDGGVWAGSSLEPRTRSEGVRGALGLGREREKLAGAIASAEREAASRSERHQRLAEDLADAERRLTEIDREVVAAEEVRARAAAEEASVSAERDRIEQELDALDRERERTERLIADLTERRGRAEQEVDALQTKSDALERRLEESGSSLDARREIATEALRKLDRWRAEARLADERVASAAREVERLEAERGQLQLRLAELAANREQQEKELADTEREVVRSRTRLVEHQAESKSARERARRSAEEVEQLSQRVVALEREVAGRREVHDRAREALHTAEMEKAAAESDWQRLRDACLSDLGRTPEALEAADPPEGASRDELAERAQGLRDRLDRLGPVNLLAVQETTELEERSTFLDEQRHDLVESLKTLDETIREIDATCTERFVDTLQQVNVVFAETFSHLLGGGTARLDLVDEDDPLESGIDITAQPPGKKNQSVQLLSGGEKALTALALLISLFRIKPSPFCILDEVDAPLDDANVARLGDLIQAMTEHTQFVLITHNRRTMQRADVLYGVTMEEPGVSKLVSVRLEEAEEMVEA